MKRCSFCEWIPILPWPVWPLAEQCSLGQNVVVGSMLVLQVALGNVPRGVCLDPRLHYECTSPRLPAELPVVSFLPYTTYTLSLDRTNWMLGCFPINFLVLSVVHQGIAFPIFWLFLPKQGNSNTQERMHLLNQFLEVFGAHKMDCLLSDREFIGEKWFAYLQQHRIRFRIRIKRDMKISQANGGFSPALNFFRSLPLATYCSLIGSRVVFGHRLYVTGMRLPAGEYVIIASNDESDSILEDYKIRWKIEVLFQALKSRGFNVEATHLKDEERLKTLFSVLTIALDRKSVV